MFKILISYRQISHGSSTSEWKYFVFELFESLDEQKRFNSRAEADRHVAEFLHNLNQKGWYYHDGDYLLKDNVIGVKVESV